MKFNVNNPAFLQSASNVEGTPETRFVFTEGNDKVQLSANGLVVVESVQGGEVVQETYSVLDNRYITINADEGTEVVIYGAVTKINQDEVANLFASIDVSKSTALTYLSCYDCSSLTSLDISKNKALTHLYCNECSSLTSLDLSKNNALTHLSCNECRSLTSIDVSKSTALTYLSCYDCSSLTSLDLSKNKALTYLFCSECAGLMLLDIQNTALLTDGAILDQSMANLTTLQVAGTSEWAYEQVEIWLSDYAPNDGTILVDENTPQEVIDAATTKDWAVEYVDA